MSMRPPDFNELAKNTFARTAMLAIVLAFPGCSSFGGKSSNAPPVEINVMPSNYRAKLVTFLTNHLTNPVGVRDAYISEPKLQPIGTENLYVVCVRYNAKDGYGQYAGTRDHIAIYFAGNLNQYLLATGEQCANAAYQRFPELEALGKPG